MSTNINYAVELKCTTQSPIISDAFGLSTDQTFRWITGRPSYNGVDNFPKWEDDTDNTEIWYEGILLKDGLTNPSRRVDIDVSGQYGSLSGINLKIANYNKIFDFIQSNTIYVVGRNVRVFVVLDDKFYQIWNGIVNNIAYDETSFTIECKDNYKQIHKVMPPNVISTAEFPESEEQGETIPIVIGNVAFSKLVDTGVKPVYVDLVDYPFFYNDVYDKKSGITTDTPNKSSDKKFQIAALASVYGITIDEAYRVSLRTQGVNFSIDELAGYYLIAKSGTDIDEGFAWRIIGNDATFKGVWGAEETKLNVYGDLGMLYDYSIQTHYYAPYDPANDKIWWFSIAKIDNTFIVSNSGYEFNKNKYGNYMLYTYDENTKIFTDISDAIESYGITGINGTNYNGISIYSDKLNIEGNISYLSSIVPEQYEVYDSTSNAFRMFTIDTYPDNGATKITTSDSRALIDKNINTFIIGQSIYLTKTHTLDIFLLYPQDKIFEDITDLYATIDYQVKSGGGGTASTTIGITSLDIYNNVIKSPETEPFLFPPGPGISVTDKDSVPFYVKTMPREYYTPNDKWPDSEYTDGTVLWGTLGGYGYLGGFYTEDYTKKLKIDDETLSRLKNGLVSIIKLTITVEFDTNRPCYIWIYQAGFVARRNLDIKSDSIYASIKGDSYTSGSATGMQASVYSAYKTILETYDGYGTTGSATGLNNYIEYSNLPEVRSDWYVGRQITERKNSYDYLNELCQQSFCVMFPTRTGNRKIVAWRDLDEYTTTIGETGIVRDSITDFSKSEPNQVFNDFKCEYSYNQATKKFDRCLVVTKSDQASFPESTDSTWKQYFQGLNSNSYADAKIVWDIAHNAYNVTNTLQQNPAQTQKLYWYYDQSIFDNTEFVGASVDDAAYRFLQNLVVWTGINKDKCSFSIPMTPANIQLELCDMILFEDGFFTDSVQRKGWITLIEVDTKKHQIKLQVTLEPIELMDDDVIIERGIPLNVDIIEESGSQPDIIIES